jgi:uncharacterized membrane protein YedE/YeeE
MKVLRYIIAGILFGIVMAKSEAISWYRIQEMFRFQSFHMYGIIGSSVVAGIVLVQFIKWQKLRDIHGNRIKFSPKAFSIWRYLLGGTVFGLGWALVGACPGPLFVNVGFGYLSYLIIIAFAILGTYLYGLLKDRLPH